MVPSSEIHALINLLDDPDEQVYAHVKTKLLSYGIDVIPSLESFWEFNDFDMLFQQRIEELIHEIQFFALKDSLETWIASGANDLLEGASLVARYQYPDLDTKKIYQKIDQLERDVWLEMNEDLTAFEKVKVFNHILFDVHGFKGNKKNYHSPQNSYINNVLESHKGNPLSLSIIYMVVAKRMNVPIFGVNLPNHFVLCYMDEHNLNSLFSDDDSQVLFFINPFSRGTIFNHKEIDQFLKELNIAPEKYFYEPCDNQTIIKRMITNLIYSYSKAGYLDKVDELNELLKVVK